jgi:hypothetical protein
MTAPKVAVAACDLRNGGNNVKNERPALWIAVLLASTCAAQAAANSGTDVCKPPKPITSPEPGYRPNDLEKQPANTAGLPSVVQTVEHALQCYQALANTKDPMQPKGLPKLSSAAMDFKTTTGKTIGFTFSVFVFKIGASREKDVTDDLVFTYSVPKVTLPPSVGFAKTPPPTLYEELVKEVQAAARAAQAQSTAMSMPLSKVGITVSYGIKFDGNVFLNVPVQLVTVGGNGDYNKNNIQTITLTFGQ